MKDLSNVSADRHGSARVASAYVLITPARNEAQYIEETLKSVVAQTVRPLRWVIVSDGSTDGTDEIVQRYVAQHPWIELLRMPERQERHFAGKVHAFDAGYARVRALPYDAIGSLDADISFDPEYFDFLLGRLREDPRLGLVGTPFEEGGETYDYRFVSIEHVSGACQLFRRECFEDIGGYVPMQRGGIDHVAVLSARMKGWRTRTFTEKVSHHHRKQGSANHGVLKAKFRIGLMDYVLGSHPLWEIFRGVYQMAKKPVILGGCMILAGYFTSLVRRTKRPVSPELIRFRQGEQMARLRRLLNGGAFRARERLRERPVPASQAEPQSR
ncbi:MAG: glycosyltransferase family 2 protein [Verrucomicrobia bacterium]|nr:glycosyltransferase family 2 protein [Verrucomicrobiota bacterium]